MIPTFYYIGIISAFQQLERVSGKQDTQGAREEDPPGGAIDRNQIHNNEK